MRTFLSRYEWQILVGGICLALGMGIGFLIPVQSPIQSEPDQYENSSQYHFINPLLECGDENFSRIQNGQVLELQGNVNSYISQEEQAGVLDTASVYFRVLNGG